MVGVEEWRATVGLYNGGLSAHAMACTPGRSRLAHSKLHQFLFSTGTVLFSILIKLLSAPVDQSLFCLVKHVIPVVVKVAVCLLAHSRHKKEQCSCRIHCPLEAGCVMATSLLGLLLKESECCVKALAILLIRAGDVEQNPGPLDLGKCLIAHVNTYSFLIQ